MDRRNKPCHPSRRNQNTGALPHANIIAKLAGLGPGPRRSWATSVLGHVGPGPRRSWAASVLAPQLPPEYCRPRPAGEPAIPGLRGGDGRGVGLTGLHVQPRLAVGDVSARQATDPSPEKNQMLCPTAPTARRVSPLGKTRRRGFV
jgi:hypothetical protein